MINLARRFDRWLHSHLFLLVALLLLIVLRIPNFFEPYWYGDEGIYLTIGNAIKNGERLYSEIVDHKTPIIYFLATVPNQLYFRFLTLVWMLVSTIAFYAVGKKIFKQQLPLIISTLCFVILTSLPWFEGNIPNGELFVMGFVLVGAWLLIRTKLFDFFVGERKTLNTINDSTKFYLAGLCFGLAILTKVPAVFDVAAWLAIMWFIMTNKAELLLKSKEKSQWWQLLSKVILQLLIIVAGIFTPILISTIYFVAVGSGQDYLQFGLLYNFHYAANWGLPFDNPILEKFFTLPGKLMIATVVYLILTFKSKKIEPANQLIAGWFILSLVGALLSNRPYPHYFQQLVPALSFLVGVIIATIKSKKKYKLPSLAMNSSLIGLFIAALLLLDFGAYPTWSYYQKFFKLIGQQISPAEYRQSFNQFMTDNYKAAEIITKSGVSEIFIWGTNPMLYALSNTNPTGKFTVSFHIKDLKAYQETMDSIRTKKPFFIVVMNDEHEELPGLNEYLENNYIINSDFTHFSFWKRLPGSLSRGGL
ncbi:hypothetical protein KJ707_02875 [Patescibacteria group bacterium]|nr:hypothetical protein [Patescibacteria group bacterium]MBU1966994.1 hypothetical protein [Patescibacteria group bacterium]MBU2543481.1 hypothetical protein [Patescibacteria group bacterium]